MPKYQTCHVYSAALPLFGSLTLLCGCTQTLPAVEAGAFRTISTLSREEFSGRVEAEYRAQASAAARELSANRGRVLVDGCGSQDVRECVVTYTDGTLSVPLTDAAPNARALIAAISRYGARMAELAEAEDLKILRGRADAAAGAAKAVAMIALPAGPLAAMVSPIVDAASWAANASRADKRRRALLGIATAAHPAIERAATTLAAMTVPLREVSTDVLSSQLNETKNAITLAQGEERTLRERLARTRGVSERARVEERIERLREGRVADFGLLLGQARDLNALRDPGVDYGLLAKAHRALIDKLADPQISLENAMRDLDFLIATAGEAVAAAKPSVVGQ